MTIRQQLESGISHHRAGRLAEAEVLYREILAREPNHSDALHMLGMLTDQIGQSDAAVELIRRSILLKPDVAETHVNLGNALANTGRFDEAIVSYRHAIRLKPENAAAQSNLGIALSNTEQVDEAIFAFRQAIRLNPDFAEAHNNLALALQTCGQVDEAVAFYRNAIRLKPDYVNAHSGLIFTMNFQLDCDPVELLAEHRAWSDRHARPLVAEMSPHSNERSPDRRLRIGYVSADFWRHSVSHFFLPLLENRDRRSFDVFCYANVQHPDDLTERVKCSCDVWRNIAGLTDGAAAGLISSDGIDILVDLSGHSMGNRLLVFARKPAPIQVTYLGYPNTTGMSSIDYRLTDALADPPEMADELNVEKLWRLPEIAWCYQPPKDAPDVRPRGNGPITFGCFNAFPKINSKLTAIWAELLNRVPGSRLLLKSIGAGQPSSRLRLTGEFDEHGIPPERIEILGRIADQRRHLELYHRVDLALDTYPYHGTTTTCEALWMGVPVVSLAGRTHASRVGASLLSGVGLSELVVQTPQQYVEVAAGLANDLPRLAELRRTLRSRMEASPLMDAPRFARNVESAYRQMWRNWCAEGGNAGFKGTAR